MAPREQHDAGHDRGPPRARPFERRKSFGDDEEDTLHGVFMGPYRGTPREEAHRSALLRALAEKSLSECEDGDLSRTEELLNTSIAPSEIHTSAAEVAQSQEHATPMLVPDEGAGFKTRSIEEDSIENFSSLATSSILPRARVTLSPIKNRFQHIDDVRSRLSLPAAVPPFLNNTPPMTPLLQPVTVLESTTIVRPTYPHSPSPLSLADDNIAGAHSTPPPSSPTAQRDSPHLGLIDPNIPSPSQVHISNDAGSPISSPAASDPPVRVFNSPVKDSVGTVTPLAAQAEDALPGHSSISGKMDSSNCTVLADEVQITAPRVISPEPITVDPLDEVEFSSDQLVAPPNAFSVVEDSFLESPAMDVDMTPQDSNTLVLDKQDSSERVPTWVIFPSHDNAEEADRLVPESTSKGENESIELASIIPAEPIDASPKLSESVVDTARTIPLRVDSVEWEAKSFTAPSLPLPGSSSSELPSHSEAPIAGGEKLEVEKPDTSPEDFRAEKKGNYIQPARGAPLSSPMKSSSSRANVTPRVRPPTTPRSKVSRPNPFLADISPSKTPSRHAASIPQSQTIPAKSNFNPFLPSTPRRAPSTPIRPSSAARVPNTPVNRSTSRPPASSLKKRHAEPDEDPLDMHPRKKLRTIEEQHSARKTPSQVVLPDPDFSPLSRPRLSSPDALALAIMEFDADRAAAERARASGSASPPTSIAPPVSFVRSGAASPDRVANPHIGKREAPIMDFRRLGAANAGKRSVARSNMDSSRTRPFITRPIPSPSRSSGSAGPSRFVSSQFEFSVARSQLSSPVRPVPPPRHVVPPSPSPGPRRVANFPYISRPASRPNPSKKEAGTASPTRSSSSARLPALPHPAKSSYVNENVFQHDHVPSPASPAKPRPPRTLPAVVSIAASRSASPAKIDAAVRRSRPSGLPRPIGASTESRLPRPVGLSKAPIDDRKPVHSVMDIDSMIPAPTNVFMTHVPSVTMNGSPSKGAISLAESSRSIFARNALNDNERSSTPPYSDKPLSALEITHPIQQSSSPVPGDDPISSHLNMSPVLSPGRRTSRRLSGQPPHGSVDHPDSASPLKPTSKRKTGNSRSGSSKPSASSRPPGEMTVTALRALTAKHTQTNEGYYNVLDVKVVFRDGPRPPSPSSKVRTILQRESEEVEQSRQARARKRGLIRGMAMEEEDNDNGERQLSPSTSSTPSVQRPLKHPRAPGDEDEYHTPKKIRLAAQSAAEDDDLISARVPLLWGVEEEARHQKGKEKGSRSASTSASPPPASKKRKFVRWDKFLATDCVEQRAESSGPASSRSDEQHPKSALASDPSSFALDNLGNLIGVTVPLKDLLKKERVVVTKVVYEDDEEELAKPIVKKARKAAKEKGKGEATS